MKVIKECLQREISKFTILRLEPVVRQTERREVQLQNKLQLAGTMVGFPCRNDNNAVAAARACIVIVVLTVVVVPKLDFTQFQLIV